MTCKKPEETKIIGNQYEVYQCCTGGLGKVYLCFDLKNDSIPVALKTPKNLPQDKRERAKILQQFEREAVAWSSLGEHPNIVQLFHMDIIDNLPFMHMEWIVDYSNPTLARRLDNPPQHKGKEMIHDEEEVEDGISLDHWLNSKVLNLQQALDFIIDICRGLDHAHKHGVIHRDLKPENVLLEKSIDEEYVAKITDFGLASIIRPNYFQPELNMEEKGIELFPQGGGTFWYMSPEQAKGYPIDERSDIYSLGCILHQLLAGYKKNREDDLKIIHQGVELPLIPDNIPSSIDKIRRKCLAYDRENRFPNVESLLKEISRAYKQIFSQLPKSQLSPQQSKASIYFNRATIQANLGNKHEAAIKLFTLSIEENQFTANAFYNRGNSYRALKKMKKAFYDYNEATHLDPTHSHAYNNIGNISLEAGESDIALECYNRAIRFDTYNIEAYLSRCLILGNQGKYDEAIADCDHVLSFAPNSAKAFYNRGVLKIHKGMYKEAVEDLKKASELDNRFTMAKEQLYELQAFLDIS